MKISWSEFRSLKKSFSFAIKGLIYCIKNERNMRIHLVVAIVVLVFAVFFKLSRIEFAILLLTFGLVVFCEIVNTSIETFINLTSPAYNGLAKIAKDVAAGGVLLMASVAVLVGLILFGNLNRLSQTFALIFQQLWCVLLFCVLLFFGFAFIFQSFNFKNLFINKAKVIQDDDKVKIYKPRKRKKLNLQ